jgi:hypothetical protein
LSTDGPIFSIFGDVLAVWIWRMIDMVESPRVLPPEPNRKLVGQEYSVVLPVPSDEFRDFVSGLLGKPQTISRVFGDPFEIRKEDIENTFHLVDQRVRQQNDASLVQFTIRISYDDGSTVLLNGLEDFSHYREIKPLVSVAVVLSGIYLIRFPEKKVPEKQEIELYASSDSPTGPRVIHVENDVHLIQGRALTGEIGIRIAHTARTWGADIEALLVGHVNTLLQLEGPLRNFIYQHSGSVGLAVATMFFLLTVTGAYFTSEQFLERQLASMRAVAGHPGNSVPDLALKLNFLIENATKGAWPRFSFALSVYLTVSLVAAAFMGVWAGTSAENRRPSFILLSQKAWERRVQLLSRRQRKWLSLAGSFVVSIAAGVIGNAIFASFLARSGK